MKKETILRRRAQELRELGEDVLALAIEGRVAQMKGLKTPRHVSAKRTKAKTTARRAAKVEAPPQTGPAQILVWSKDGRIFIQPPPCAHGGVTRTLAYKLKEAATVNGDKHYKYEGGAFKPNTPERAQWSFARVDGVFAKVKQVLGDFFSTDEFLGLMVEANGNVYGSLPKSTYEG